jgi:hypothetical protein
MARITLMRALSKLKTTEKEIKELLTLTTQTKEPNFVGLKRTQDTYVKGTTLNKEEFSTKAKSIYDRLNNLIDLQRNLKKAISTANNTILVDIIGKKMTITEVLFYKETIKYKYDIMKQMNRELVDFKVTKEKYDSDFKKYIEEFTRTGPNVTYEEKIKLLEDAKKLLEPTMEINIVDPLDVHTKIDKLDEEIKTFNAEIDFVLNEVNSKETIEVDD